MGKRKSFELTFFSIEIFIENLYCFFSKHNQNNYSVANSYATNNENKYPYGYSNYYSHGHSDSGYLINKLEQ